MGIALTARALRARPVKPTGQLLPEAAPVALKAEAAPAELLPEASPADEASSAPRDTASSAPLSRKRRGRCV